MEKFESQSSPLDIPGFVDNLRERFARELEELITDPKFKNANFDINSADKIRSREKIKAPTLIRDLLVRIGQDFRLTPDEIDRLEEMFIENEDEK